MQARLDNRRCIHSRSSHKDLERPDRPLLSLCVSGQEGGGRRGTCTRVLWMLQDASWLGSGTGSSDGGLELTGVMSMRGQEQVWPFSTSLDVYICRARPGVPFFADNLLPPDVLCPYHHDLIRAFPRDLDRGVQGKEQWNNGMRKERRGIKACERKDGLNSASGALGRLDVKVIFSPPSIKTTARDISMQYQRPQDRPWWNSSDRTNAVHDHPRPRPDASRLQRYTTCLRTSHVMRTARQVAITRESSQRAAHMYDLIASWASITTPATWGDGEGSPY
jgi:hypothetical protein